jgi:uncharacterized GH25 family protein
MPQLKVVIGRRLVRWAATILLLGETSAASAHTFWLQPDRFAIIARGVVPITLQVGHGIDRQRSRVPRRRIVRFSAIGPNGRQVDLRDKLDLGGAVADAFVPLNEPGTHVIILETDDRAESHLPAARFNQHLEAEGLTPALELRRRTSRTNVEGSENYGRRAKAIVRVGASTAESSMHVTEPFGLTLEIVPEIDPYATPRPTRLPLRVLYEGRPLPGALVRLTQLENDATPFEARRTDRNGRTTFGMPPSGTWLLSVVWTKPLPTTRTTQFETIFSSLSFGLAPE